LCSPHDDNIRNYGYKPNPVFHGLDEANQYLRFGIELEVEASPISKRTVHLTLASRLSRTQHLSSIINRRLIGIRLRSCVVWASGRGIPVPVACMST
jgi:hypothetical protein